MTLLLLTNLGLAGGGVPVAGYAFVGDLTTVFRSYIDALHDTAIVASDTDTLLKNDEDEMIAGTSANPDRNTRYNTYLH